MILVAGGDSFLYGAELMDQFPGPSLSTCSALLAKENKMIYQTPKQITDQQVAHLTPTNIRFTPVVITVPKVLPKRDDKVTLL